MSDDPFAHVSEQHEAKRLLTAALADDGAHAFLFHGPAGVGKTAAAFAFAGVQLGDARRVEERTHPDLQVIEPLGDMIRVAAIDALHHDLHLRPFEADRRVYLLLGAHLLNLEAASMLLKDLEEPPLYATIVLVADELGPTPRDDPLSLSARPVPAAVRARHPRLARRAGTRARRRRSDSVGTRRRRPARPGPPAYRPRRP